MTGTPIDMTAEFDERYRLCGEPAVRRVERRVIGAEYGATSYTTRSGQSAGGQSALPLDDDLERSTPRLLLGCRPFG
jgi:hypothetical protein